MGSFVTSPEIGTSARSINPATDVTLENETLYVGGAGDVEVVLYEDSASVTLVGIPAGTFLPLAIKEVKSVGTTATNLVAIR